MGINRSQVKKIGKGIEHAIRRTFISSLKFRSRFKSPPASVLPVDLPENPTILFLRQDRLGDAIVSTPVLVELYKKYPNAHFVILLGDNNKGIAELLPIPCEVVIYRKKPFADSLMLRRLRRRKIDILIDLIDNPSSTSSILITAIAPKFAIGIEKDNSSSYNYTVPLLNRSQFHIARRIAELLRPFGIDTQNLSLQPKLKELTIKRISGKVGIIISAGAPDRYIPQRIIAETAENLLSNGFATEVQLLFHPKDKKLAHEIIKTISDPRIILSEPTYSFLDYAKKIASCEFIISPDTSAIHLCSAYNIPVIGVYAPFPPELHYWTPIGVPYEMIVGRPNLEHLRSEEIMEATQKLVKVIKPQLTEQIFAG